MMIVPLAMMGSMSMTVLANAMVMHLKMSVESVIVILPTILFIVALIILEGFMIVQEHVLEKLN